MPADSDGEMDFQSIEIRERYSIFFYTEEDEMQLKKLVSKPAK